MALVNETSKKTSQLTDPGSVVCGEKEEETVSLEPSGYPTTSLQKTAGTIEPNKN